MTFTKKIIAAAVLAVTASTSALAAEPSKLSIGGGVGLNYGGVWDVHLDYDISDLTNREPFKVRVGYQRYDNSVGPYRWSYNVVYGGAYYDFNRLLKVDSRLHPFVGVVLGMGSVSCNNCPGWAVNSPTVGGLDVIGGIQYDLDNRLNVEAGVNAWGGVGVGVNYKF